MTLADELLEAYLRRDSTAERARSEDPLYHAHIHQLRRWVTVTDMAMDDEGIPEPVRRRVLQSVVYGGTGDPDAAMKRIEDHRAAAKRLAAGGPLLSFRVG